MRPPAVLLLVILAASPLAAAWPASFHADVDPELSIKSSLLVAGHIRANVSVDSTGTVFGAPFPERLHFGDAAVIRYCPDRPNDATSSAADCGDGQTTTGARVRLLAGGVILTKLEQGEARVDAPAAAAVLGGSNVTINRVRVGPAVFVGGFSTVQAEGSSFLLRPFDKTTSIELRGEQGHRLYNGSRFTLRIQNAEGASFESRGVFLQASPGTTVTVEEAPVDVIESNLRLEDLYTLMRRVVPSDRADRRADLVHAFGPFQVSPALLNSVVASTRNLSVNGVHYGSDFVLVRANSASLRLVETNWTGGGDGAYFVQRDSMARNPTSFPRLPLVLPAVLAVLALGGRMFTERRLPRGNRRLLRRFLRAGVAVGLFLAATLVVSGVFGVNLLTGWDVLSLRSRVQLGLLAAGLAILAYGLVGIAAASLTRSLFALKGRPDAGAWPSVVGGAGAVLFLVLARYALIAAVSRLVRL